MIKRPPFLEGTLSFKLYPYRLITGRNVRPSPALSVGRLEAGTRTCDLARMEIFAF